MTPISDRDRNDVKSSTHPGVPRHMLPQPQRLLRSSVLFLAGALALTLCAAPAALAQDAGAQSDLKVPDDIEGDDDELTPAEKKKRKEEAIRKLKERQRR